MKNLAGYIESILNPNGRFRTLEGIYAVRDGGEPSMTLSADGVDFEVVWQGAPHILRCLSGESEQSTDMLRELSLYTSHVDSPHLMPYVYLEGELVSFDSADRTVLSDVILQRLPEGERLDRLVSREARSGNGHAMAGARKALAALSQWLCENDFAHHRISSRNIYITPRGDAVLVNYAHSSRRGSSLRDQLVVGALTAALYVVACRPELYDRIVQSRILTEGGMRRLTYLVSDLMADERAAALRELLDLMKDVDQSQHGDAPVRELSRAIGNVARMPPHRYAALERIAPHTCDGDRAEENPKWRFVGEMHEMVMRVFDGHEWRYVDKTGREAFAGTFLYACDFGEGRAVVETSGGYGLIDLDGRFVIEPRCADIEWDIAHNVAIVTVDGQSGLYDRNGVPLTGLIYDQILGGNEGLFLVKKEQLFGYIHCDGRMAIRPQFDDAFGFRNDCARVRTGNRSFLIDRDGNQIETVTEKAVCTLA
jgi:hypothetical protein